ncbi:MULTISPECIES: hypothetical protein [Shewanella]|uniref:hypothetical protein n=1 Tax=Shewanella TaxID=22 RepID=UPI0004BAA5E0|nr:MULTISPECIES: hypothetical protein [Shewanella]QLE85160.1 hypothetical protein FLM48_08690 [Shewanella sp. Scap07]
MKPIPLLTALLLTMLVGCSAKKATVEDFQDQVEDQFRTSIKGDGIKLFVYKVRKVNNKELPHVYRAKQAKRSSRNSGPDLSDWTEQIELGLLKTIDMTGFCREGYFELSRIIEYGRGEIRGECIEGASEADKQAFAS